MRKTAKGLVKYAKAQLGNPYWYGTFGQKATKELYAQKKAQYPSYYTATDYQKQYGKKVHDCIGLIKGYLWCTSPDDAYPVYLANGCPDINEEMMYSFVFHLYIIPVLRCIGLVVYYPVEKQFF